ncbi:MAG TPA: FecR domain-containing protein [Flavobacteriales bacterium]|nr:FecR domain-containing protein [Flavobacteriales bacterium]
MSGNTNPDETARLAQWRKQDPLNELLFQKSEKVWRNTSVLNEAYHPDLGQGWANVQEKIKVNQPQRPVALWQPWMRVAAALIVLAGVTWIMTLFVLTNKQPHQASPLTGIKPVNAKKEIAQTEPNYVEMQAGDICAEFVLPDGSLVYLNKNSKVTYPENFSGTERPVHLVGEAFFEVNKNKEKPFIIYCGETKTEVTGTTLNVRGYENEENVEVTVVTGTVAFSDMRNGSDKKIVLAANDHATFNKQSAAMAKGKSKKTAWWKKGNLKKGWKNLIRRIKHKI